ncbi:MAG: alpha/beta hydrolase-fold protein [Alteraurantiacibacter sp.]
MRLVALLLALVLAGCASVPPAAESPARFVEIERMAADGLPDQRLTIWLPPGYDGSDSRYPVLYMHDGHNLFDPAVSNFQKVWAADKAMLEAAASGAVEPHIIVGIWAPGEDRYRQYLPAFAPGKAEGAVAEDIAELAGGPIISQHYLDWITGFLKPTIDARYRTRTGPADTAIAGSSMGGINSCWAIMERPDIFGRAACVSSHWPLIMPEEEDRQRGQVLGMWAAYIADKLGEPAGRRIWMDHGTATLDAFYPPYQAAVDADFRAAGWVEGRDFRSEQYDGAEHEENAWAARLPEILVWLLARE